MEAGNRRGEFDQQREIFLECQSPEGSGDKGVCGKCELLACGSAFLIGKGLEGVGIDAIRHHDDLVRCEGFVAHEEILHVLGDGDHGVGEVMRRGVGPERLPAAKFEVSAGVVVRDASGLRVPSLRPGFWRSSWTR